MMKKALWTSVTATLLLVQAYGQPQVGEPAPDFELVDARSGEKVRLSSFKGKSPVVLIFGSPDNSLVGTHAGRLDRMCRSYKDRAAFLWVYTTDIRSVFDQAEDIPDPDPMPQQVRTERARTFAAARKLAIPVLVDDHSNTTVRTYRAYPQCLYVIGKDGKVAYAGMSEHLLNPTQCELALRESLDEHGDGHGKEK